MVSPPVVVSATSDLRKLPPAINVPELFVVPDTFKKVADVFVPSNTAPRVSFNVIPDLIAVNPVCDD